MKEPSVAYDGMYGYWGELEWIDAKRIVAGQNKNDYIIFKNKGDFYLMSDATDLPNKIVRYGDGWTFKDDLEYLKTASEASVKRRTGSNVMKLVNNYACLSNLELAISYDAEDYKHIRALKLNHAGRLDCKDPTRTANRASTSQPSSRSSTAYYSNRTRTAYSNRASTGTSSRAVADPNSVPLEDLEPVKVPPWEMGVLQRVQKLKLSTKTHPGFWGRIQNMRLAERILKNQPPTAFIYFVHRTQGGREDVYLLHKRAGEFEFIDMPHHYIETPDIFMQMLARLICNRRLMHPILYDAEEMKRLKAGMGTYQMKYAPFDKKECLKVYPNIKEYQD